MDIDPNNFQLTEDDFEELELAIDSNIEDMKKYSKIDYKVKKFDKSLDEVLDTNNKMYTDKYTPKDADNNFQIDSLRLEMKRMESHIKSLNDALNHQNEKIQFITTFLKQKEKDNDKFVEINDRIDDLESRIDLLDE